MLHRASPAQTAPPGARPPAVMMHLRRYARPPRNRYPQVRQLPPAARHQPAPTAQPHAQAITLRDQPSACLKRATRRYGRQSGPDVGVQCRDRTG
jgi:hypothetical protein